MTKISFPGLNIGEFELNSAAISFGESFSLYWNGIFIAVSILLAFLYALMLSKREGVKFDDLLDITLFSLIFGVIGARLFYGMTSSVKFNGFIDAISVWDGRLSMYGGMIAGAITIALVCKIKKISTLKVFDLVSPALMLSQIVGRWGDFFNGTSYGIPVAEDSALYFLRMGISPHVFEDIKGLAYVHPTFLYESLWNLVGLVLIAVFCKKKKFDGHIVLSYLAWYGLGRTMIEGLRVDALHIGVFRFAQVVGLISFVACTLTLIYKLARVYRKQKDSEEYVPAYKRNSNPAFIFEKTDEEPDYTPSFNFGKKEEDERNENKNADDGEEE
jgi:phosphatidylglycerol:prolipoprotein diacylglycerol transferase